MRLWDWAVEAYGRPGVEAAVLDLQDQDGQCVCYLLWALWRAGEGRRAPLEPAVRLARDWEAGVVAPLRAARRRIKALEPRLHPPAKALELSAERALLDRLEGLAGPSSPKAVAAGPALAAAAQAWGQPVDSRRLSALLASLDP